MYVNLNILVVAVKTLLILAQALVTGDYGFIGFGGRTVSIYLISKVRRMVRDQTGPLYPATPLG